MKANMEPIRILKLIWTLITLLRIFAKGQDQHAGPPDIMMYYNYKQSQVTCVAGTNTYGNAMTFITPLEYRVNPVFQYKDRNGNNIDEIGCDYEKSYVGQQCNPKFTNKMSSGKYLTSPVTDERWNKFDTQYTTGRNPEYSYIYRITETNFHISFSVRTWSDAQILLCNSQGATSRYPPENCYWILIDAFKHKNETFLRKCTGKIPDDYPRGDNNPCKIPRAHKEVKLLSEKKWTHFTVTRENGNTIILWESNHKSPILNYTDEEPFDIESLYIRGTNNVKAEWKIHDYRYLVITKMNQYIKLGTFSFTRSDTLCISLYVAVCSRCAMEIRVESDRGSEVTKTIYGKQGIFIPWQLEKLEVQANDSFIYTLYIKATAEAGVTDTFWAVDDIRRCYSDEIKVSSMQVAQQAMNSITCQSLQYPEWNFTEFRNTNNSTECSDSRFTGTYCNISCKSILSSDYCENNMICRPTVLDAPTQCTCAPNSSGPKCSTECSYGYFGYNCQNKCGKCQGGKYRCDKISGKCSYGCEESYTPPHCIDIIGPVLLAPPTVVSVSHTSVTIRLDNITTFRDMTADTFQIEYKLAGSTWPWQQDMQRVQLDQNKEVTVSGLQREATYSIRVVLYALNGNTYRLENVPYTNATTTCEVNRMANIESSARHVNITLHNNEEGCLITNYFVILTPNKKRQYFQQNWEQIANLKPFKTYTIIIGNYLYPEYNYTTTFTTMEDAPSAVRNLKALRTSDTTITVTWDVPLEENGNIIIYMVSTELQKYIDCPWNAKGDMVQYIIVTPDKISDVLIPNLHPYARYKVSVIAVTVANGTEISETFDTLSSNGVSDLELPNNVTVDAYSKNVNVKWIRPTCANILGPLRYNISIKCIHDPWCDQVKPVTREVDGSNTYVSVNTLTPFTNYTLELRVSRNGTISEQSITVYFATKEGAPPEVRSLKDYSRDGDFISLRWLAPYPPLGILEYYEVEYCFFYYRYSCSYGQKKRVNPVPCSLWDEDEYMCFDITNTEPSCKYKISVRAKNTRIMTTGAANTIETKTEQISSSVPLNLNATWNQNMLILHWDCPDLPGGPLKYFLITLRQFDTEILANKGRNKEYYYKLEVDKQPLRKKYNYTIDQIIPHSTSYNITVYGVNKYNGTTATMEINTPPETPILEADIVINNEGITNTTIPITIPGVQANTTSSTSYVYVIVSEHEYKHIVKQDADLQESSKKDEILQFAPDTEDTWIAAELPSRDSNSTFIVGSNSRTHSEHLDEDLINKPLKPSRAYDITIVLMNVYRNKRSYKDYKSPSRVNTAAAPVPPSSAGLYALLLLLFVPVLLYFLYRRIMSKNPGFSSPDIINRPDWSIPRTGVASYIEVIHENGIGSTSNIQMTDQSNKFPIYDTVKNNTDVSELKPIYSNITTEATYANVILTGAPVLPLPSMGQ